MMIIIFLLAVLLSVLMILLNSSISLKAPYREKQTSFECGFDPKSSPRLPFSMQFFLIAMLFLIFDVEISLISPLPILFSFISQLNWIFINSIFIIILMIGVAHEWNEGSLSWSK
uniref:NADH-ubiquinone oxidoreductase chain 3 n=1 Tax=Lipothrix lubbocki TaxID=1387126 RepID=A0A6H0EXD8_9HEXA|nr:NADH dehydrogenase subunit 3 [Lipothrix lubbocki]